MLGVAASLNKEIFWEMVKRKVLMRGGIERFTEMGAVVREIDFSPFFEAAELLYGGPLGGGASGGD